MGGAPPPGHRHRRPPRRRYDFSHGVQRRASGISAAWVSECQKGGYRRVARADRHLRMPRKSVHTAPTEHPTAPLRIEERAPAGMRPGGKKTSRAAVGNDKCVVADNALPQALAPRPPRVESICASLVSRGTSQCRHRERFAASELRSSSLASASRYSLVIGCHSLRPTTVDRRE